MKGVLVFEMNLAEDVQAAAAQVVHAMRKLRGATTPQIVDDIIVLVDDPAEDLLAWLKEER